MGFPGGTEAFYADAGGFFAGSATENSSVEVQIKISAVNRMIRSADYWV
mgnify:FL=1